MLSYLSSPSETQAQPRARTLTLTPIRVSPHADYKGLELKMDGVINGVAFAALLGIIQGQIIGFSSGFKDGVTYVCVSAVRV